MSTSLFVQITALLQSIKGPDGTPQTEVFLHVCRQVIPVIEKFGTSFLIVKSDIQGNIDRLASRFQTRPDRYTQLYPIVLDEVTTGDTGNTSCTKGLLWLQRAMSFVAGLLRRLFDDRQVTLANAASDVYTETLYQYHGWITSAAFTVALKLVPSREAFLQKLGVPNEELYQEMASFLDAFQPVLQAIHTFLVQNNLDDPTKV